MSDTAPYRGLEPFLDTDHDARRFFAREGERDLLIANLMAYQLTVLHGESGTGKSSLLRAGVAYQLRVSAGGPPVAAVVFADWHEEPLARLADAVDDAVANALGRLPDGGRQEWSLSERLAAAAITLDGGLYVLLDQVEELLLYHGGDAALLSEIGEALSARSAGASFLLAIRDDALGQLDVLRSFAPAILVNTLRLNHLDRNQAERAVRGPLTLGNSGRLPDERFTIEDGLVTAVLDQVAVGRVEVGLARGAASGGAEEGVAAPYLQLVLERVWREEQASGSRELRLATLERLGGSETIVSQHLREALDSLSIHQRELAARVFGQLVTPSGAKVAHTTRDLAGYARVEEAELQPTLDGLSRHRVLRPVATSGAQRYEVYHDVLAAGILAWTQQHEQEVAIRLERHEARRRQRRLLAALLALAALCIFAVVEWRRADRQETTARAQALAATASAELATDPERSLALAAHAVRLSANENTTGVLRQALIQAHERVVIRPSKPVVSAAFSPDGSKVLVVSSKGPARVVRAANGSRLLVLVTPGSVRAAAWSPDGRNIATLAAAPARSVWIWDSRTGRVTRRLSDRGVRFISYSPDGRQLLTASQTHLRIHDAKTGALEREIAHPGGVAAARFSPDGSRIATIDTDGRTHVYDTGDGAPAYTLPLASTAFAFSADGARLATAGAHSASVLDAATGRLLLSVPVGGPSQATHCTAVGLSAHGGTLLVGDSNGTTRVWSVAHRKQTGVLVGQLGRITSAVFSSGGRWILTASADHTARVWRASDDDPWTLLAGSADNVSSAAFSPNAGSVLTVSDDGTARVWSAGTADPLRAIARVHGAILAAAPVPGGNVVLLAGPGHTATLLDTTRRRVVLRLTEPARVVAVAANDDTLATAAGRHITLWTNSGRRLKTLTARATVTSVALDDGGRSAVGTATGTVDLYDSDGRLLQRLSGPRSPALSVAYSSDGRRLVVGLARRTAWIWDVQGKGKVLEILRGHRDKVLAAHFSPDGSAVATASLDHDARLWNARTGQLMDILRLHVGRVSDVAFSPDGRWIATAGPSSAGLFPSATGVYLLVLTGPRARLSGVWFGRDGLDVFAASTDGIVRGYECQVCGTNTQLLSLAESRLRHVR